MPKSATQQKFNRITAAGYIIIQILSK